MLVTPAGACCFYRLESLLCLQPMMPERMDGIFIPASEKPAQQQSFPPVRFLISSRHGQFRVSSLAQTPPSERTYVDVGRSDELGYNELIHPSNIPIT